MPNQREIAISLMQQRKFDKALPVFLHLLEINQNDSDLYYMAGQCFRFINNIPEAIQFLSKAVSINDNEPQYFLALGIAYQLNENYEKAIELLKNAIRLDDKLFTAYNSIGLTYRKLGEFNEALKWYSSGIECYVNNVSEEVYKDKEKCFGEEVSDGKKTLVVLPYALEKTHEILRSSPTYAILRNNMGVCLLELGDLELARKQFRESIKFIPDGYDYPDPFRHLEEIS